MLFLICFNPIIQSVAVHPSRGFSLSLQNDKAGSPLPEKDNYIYAFWDEKTSDEQKGWYLAKVLSVDGSGNAVLKYRSGGLTEEVSLLSIDWSPAKGNGKWFLSPTTPPQSLQPSTATLSTPHKVKGYADDLTIITSSPSDHQDVLSHMDERCSDVCLTIRPDKCFSLVLSGGKEDQSVFKVGDGVTTSIKENPSTFLGSVIGCNKRVTKKTASRNLLTQFLSALSRVDASPIRGEYKIWIYKRYLVPSLHYKFTVNGILKASIKKMNAKATKLVKSWLGLTRSTTVAVLHHPAILDIPFLSDFNTKAKLSYLSSVFLSKDPFIDEISSIALSSPFMEEHGIPLEAKSIHAKAMESIISINRKTLSSAARLIHRKKREDVWSTKLESLTVQCKYSEVCTLEKENRVWGRIIDGLPAGHLSFMLRAASDTLPTPLNLKRWKYRLDAKCHLCNSNRPTTAHILNGCTIALEQGRYTWRHDSVLLTLLKGLKSMLQPEDKLYGDLAGYWACESPHATVPTTLVCTTARPDIVIVRPDDEVVMLELTVPGNTTSSLQQAHSRKISKENYQMLQSDLEAKNHVTSFMTVEVGALGHSLPSTVTSLKVACPEATKPKLKRLLDEAAKVAITASYTIFLARNDTV